MVLVNSWEKQGNFLFKYRGQFPVILFVLAVPFLYYSKDLPSSEKQIWNYIALSISVVGFLIRFYTIGTTPKGTSGRNTNKQVAEVLNSSGIYAVVRHPLYLGNYLIWIGITCFVFNVAFIVLVTLLFWLYYERIMFAEERFLEKKFGNKYLEWSNKIPAFIPSISKFRSSTIPFSIKTVLRREYSGVLATVLGFCFIEFIRNIKLEEELFSINMIYLLVITIFISLFLRFLKRYTKVLFEENRS